jgi:hypothetical protein
MCMCVCVRARGRESPGVFTYECGYCGVVTMVWTISSAAGGRRNTSAGQFSVCSMRQSVLLNRVRLPGKPRTRSHYDPPHLTFAHTVAMWVFGNVCHHHHHHG